jgi:hypothetical protein
MPGRQRQELTLTLFFAALYPQASQSLLLIKYCICPALHNWSDVVSRAPCGRSGLGLLCKSLSQPLIAGISVASWGIDESHRAIPR